VRKKNIPREFMYGRLKVLKKKNISWNCVQIDINKCKIENWKERSKSRAD